MQGQVRTLKSALESRLGRDVADDHPALPRLVIHASSVISRYQKDFNGRTAYGEVNGRDYEHEVLEFGESIWYMKPGFTGKHKLDARWKAGLWLGIWDRSNESIVGNPDGCLKVRSLRRMPLGQR